MGRPANTPLDAIKFVSPEPNTGCWVWTGSADPRGYGHVMIKRKCNMAHRVVYELLVGPIPEGLQLDHLCHNPWCVNPEHLEPVTPTQNNLRGLTNVCAVNSRKTHCKRGHELTGYNLKLVKKGRMCRTCQNMKRREWRARQ